MPSTMKYFPLTGLFLAITLLWATPLIAEDEEPEDDSQATAETQPVPPPPPREEAPPPRPQQRPRPPKASQRRYYVATDPNERRVDAGIFHVGFAVGGNFYIEPKINPTTRAPLGEYFKDFGFQGGMYFDYDYSELDENIPLGLRGMLGYKYILASVHVFAFDGVVRRMFRWSDDASFGIGGGGSAAVWYRAQTSTSPDEEIIFLPSFVVTAGFEFTPFMIDFKWLVNRFGEDSTITGLELYFGFRL